MMYFENEIDKQFLYLCKTWLSWRYRESTGSIHDLFMNENSDWERKQFSFPSNHLLLDASNTHISEVLSTTQVYMSD